MNILYFIPGISREWGGVYQYSLSLLKSLAADKDYQHRFYVYLLNEDENYRSLSNKHSNIHLILEKDKKGFNEPLLSLQTEPFSIARYSLIPITRRSSKVVRFFGTRYNYRLLQKYKKRGYKETTYLDWIIKKYKIDIVHCPYQSVYLASNVPSITTMHDVQELYYPDFFSSQERADRAVNYKRAIDNASAVMVSYEHIKRDIIKFFAKPESKVHVCLLDMQDLWFEKYSDKDILDLSLYNIPTEFILYPAATWAHKNHLQLLEAIAYIKNQFGVSVNLVCTGHLTDHYSEVKRRIEELSITNQVIFLGIVNDQLLYSLYHKTAGVVVPTLYEAGSFPLMESILMGVPVICSKVTSLPETIGDPSFIFEPNNSQEMAEKIYQLLYDKAFKENNIRNSQKQAGKLRNNAIVKRVNDVYNSVVKSEYNNSLL